MWGHKVRLPLWGDRGSIHREHIGRQGLQVTSGLIVRDRSFLKVTSLLRELTMGNTERVTYPNCQKE